MKNDMMACTTTDMQDKVKLYKFTKILTLKVAQIVVQSRQGKKIVHDITRASDDSPPASAVPPTLQWFNLSIPDVPEVNSDTKKVLNGEVMEALSNVLCIEIVLRTSEGDEMVLEMWSVRLGPAVQCESSVSSVSNIYYRMSIMLKSTLSITRITPAYKLSRLQSRESYKIFYKIYGGQPNLELLGENYKTIKVSELHTPIGTLQIDVAYRTKMNILPDDHKPVEKNVLQTSDNIMIKSDHFPKESPRRSKKMSSFRPIKNILPDDHMPTNKNVVQSIDKMVIKNDHFSAESSRRAQRTPSYQTKLDIQLEEHQPKARNLIQSSKGIMIKSDHFAKETQRKKFNDKKEIDLSRPLTAGAFVDTAKIKELHDTLSQQLPPEPPMMWLLAEKDKMEKKMKRLSMGEASSSGGSGSEQVQACCSAASSRAIEVPRAQDAAKYDSLMEFPFADGSPIAELANFYRECMQARSAAGGEWASSPPVDRASLAATLRCCEEAVPEFDNLVAELCAQRDPHDR